MATPDANLREHVLDAALLRDDVVNFLSVDEQEEILDPIRDVQANGVIPNVICRDCPSYNFGLFTPTTAWQTHSGSLRAELVII